MVLHNQITASSSSGNTANIGSTDSATQQYIMAEQRQTFDLVVAMIAVPILVLFFLQIKNNLHKMANSPESRWLVFALGIGMLIVIVIICGYVKHRRGVCIWAGPIDEVGNPSASVNMVLHNQITESSSSGNTANIGSTHSATQQYIMAEHRQTFDLMVATTAVTILAVFSMLIETNLHKMANSPESRWLVCALGIGMLIDSVIVCGYFTHRIGVCVWVGPIYEVGNHSASEGTGEAHINSQNDILRIVDSLPPSYDSVVKFDIPPPRYDCIVIDMEQCKDEPGTEDKPTLSTENSAVHM